MTRPYLTLGVGAVAASAVAIPAVALGASGHRSHRSPQPGAQVHLSGVSVAGDRVTVSGTVAVTPDTRTARARSRVVLKLDGHNGYERYVLTPGTGGAFTKTWTTTLHGAGHAYLRAEIRDGFYSGTEVTRAVSLPAAAKPSKTTTVTVTAPTPTAPPSSAISTTSPSANEIPLVGTFQIQAGSTFEMFTPGKLAPVPPGSLALTAGSDGGLETFGYQPAPATGFDAKGNALAARIIKPLPFDGVNFTVDTQANDLQGGAADPVPTLDVNQTGQISGQVTAWDAQWNNQNFNQGSPKPDGTTPGATTKVTGTYNWATGAYSINWQSLIVGGPFNNFVGTWHLQGTFAPAKFS